MGRVNFTMIGAVAATITLWFDLFDSQEVSSGERSGIPAPPTCDEAGLQREATFRLGHVDNAVNDRLGAEGVPASDSCAPARSIFVAAKLGGIVRRPPPKEDETVWTEGDCGCGCRHAPFKAGARSDEFAGFSLPEPVEDRMSCAGGPRPDADSTLLSAVKDFGEAATASAGDREQERAERKAAEINSWTVAHQPAGTLAKIGKAQQHDSDRQT